MSEYFYKFLLRRDNLSELDSTNPILSSGEPAFAIDKNVLKIGDGEHVWQELPSFISSRELKHKNVAISLPQIAAQNSYYSNINIPEIDSNNEYAVLASTSSNLPSGIIISSAFASGDNNVIIKFTNISQSNISNTYNGFLNIVAYMTKEAIVTPITTTTPVPVKDSFYSFGYNNFGQLGLNDIENRLKPTYASGPVYGNTENLWNEISLGYYHTLAISKSGDLFSFGYNYYGQLGNGEFGVGKNKRKPTLVNSGISWERVSAGAYHSLAIGDNGKLFCFGSNAHGSLGLGDTNFRKDITELNSGYIYENISPVSSGRIINDRLLLNYKPGDSYLENKLYTLPLNSSVVISTDPGYYVAVLNRGKTNLIAYSGVPNNPLTTSILKTVTGTDYDGEYVFYNGNISLRSIGNYDSVSLYFYNVVLDSFSYYGGKDIIRFEDKTGWTNISAGHYHSLGIKNGYLYSWGNNAFGQLGLGDNLDRYKPTLVSTENNWVSVSAGNYHSLAIKNNAGTYELYTFGKNDYGQLGLNSTLPQIKIPTKINSSFNEISLYNTSNLQSASNINIDSERYVFNYSLGKNYNQNDRYILSEGSYIISGVPSTHPIAFLNNGKQDLFTYIGQNNAGTKIVNGFEYTFYHGNVTINVYGNFDEISAYSLYGGYAGGEGIFLYNNSAAFPVDIDAGIDFSVVRTNLGEVWTFGKNNLGQLGLGDYDIRSKPYKIKEYDWTNIKAGANHVLLLDSSKKMWSFGDNSYGQLGLGDTFGRNEPTVVNSLERYDDISAGGNHSVGLIFSASPTTPIITNILNSNDANDIYDRNLKITIEDSLSEQYGVYDYTVESGVTVDGPWRIYNDSVSDNKYVNVSGLTVGTNYIFRVRSKNEEGFSDYSNISSGIPERLIDDLYCSTMLLLHFDENLNSSSRFTSSVTSNNSSLNSENSVFGKSYFNNGLPRILSYTNNTDFNIPNDFCIEFYFKPSGVSSENIIRSIIYGNTFNDPNGTNSFGIFSSGNNIIAAEKLVSSSINTIFNYQIPINDRNNWNHFAWVRDGLTHKLFFNGVQVSQLVKTTGIPYTQSSIIVGNGAVNSNNSLYSSFSLKGFLDEVRITKQDRYDSPFSNDLFKRPFGETSAEPCGSSFNSIPLLFDSAYSWNYDIGRNQTILGTYIFDLDNETKTFNSGIYLNSGQSIEFANYSSVEYPLHTINYIEAYSDSIIPNSITLASGITGTGNGTFNSPFRVSGIPINWDSKKIFEIKNSGNINISSSIAGYGPIYLLTNGFPFYGLSGIVKDFDKYNVSGIGTPENPMSVKIGRNFFFNKPRELNRVWLKVNVDGFLDIDLSKWNNSEGISVYKTKESPYQHLEYALNSNQFVSTDIINLYDKNSFKGILRTKNKYTNYAPIIDTGLVDDKDLTTSHDGYQKDYDLGYKTGVSSTSPGQHPTRMGYEDAADVITLDTSWKSKVFRRYENIPIKKDEYIILSLQSNLDNVSECLNSGEFLLKVREANNLLDLDFEKDFCDKSLFDHKMHDSYGPSYDISFDKDSVDGFYSLKFPKGLSNNPINDISNYRYPLSIDMPVNFLGIKPKFTIETFFKFNQLNQNQTEYHRIFALERPLDLLNLYQPGYIFNNKRDYISLVLQTSGTSIASGYFSFNSESVSGEFGNYDYNSLYYYGLKDSERNDIFYNYILNSGQLNNISMNDWNHAALVKYYDNLLLFINGKPVLRNVIARKKYNDNESDIYVIKNLKTWNGNFSATNISVSSGDIIGLRSSAPITTVVQAYYTNPEYEETNNLISGYGSIVAGGQGNRNSKKIILGNYANNKEIFRCNYNGLVTLEVNVSSGNSSTGQDLIVLKNGIARKSVVIDNDLLEIPPKTDVRNGLIRRKVGAPFTIGPINGKFDSFKISADSKYILPFDSSILKYRNNEYYSYEKRKYKKSNSYIYNVSCRDVNDNDITSNTVILFDQIQSKEKNTSVSIKINSVLNKIRFSLKSYKPNMKIKFSRTNLNKELPNNGLTRNGTINYLGNNNLNPCSTFSINNFYNPQQPQFIYKDFSIVNFDLLTESSGVYSQNLEFVDIWTPDFAQPFDYLNIDVIHDDEDLTPTTPTQPLNLVVNSGYESLSFLWDHPSNYGGEKLRGYILQSRVNGQENQYEFIPKINSYEINNLTGGVGYNLSLAARNIIGSGEFTSSILAYPKQSRVPFAPRYFSSYSTSGSILLNWFPPDNNGGRPITGYRVSYTQNGNTEQTINLTQDYNRILISGLNNNNIYNTKIAAINNIGTGDYTLVNSNLVKPKYVYGAGNNQYSQLSTNDTAQKNNFTQSSGTYTVYPNYKFLEFSNIYNRKQDGTIVSPIPTSHYSYSGVGTDFNKFQGTLGGDHSDDNRMWIKILENGVISGYYWISSQTNQDGWSIYKASGISPFQHSSYLKYNDIPIPSNFKRLSIGASSGDNNPDGANIPVENVSSGDYIIIQYTKNSTIDYGSDSVRFELTLTSSTKSTTPTMVPIGDWLDISANSLSCAINSSGTLYIIGTIPGGENSDINQNRWTPVVDPNLEGGQPTKFKKCFSNGGICLAISERGYLYGLGLTTTGQLGRPFNWTYGWNYYQTFQLIRVGHTSDIQNKNDWVDVKATNKTTVALDQNNDMWMFGDNNADHAMRKIEILDDISNNGYLKWKYINVSSAATYLDNFILAIDLYDRLFCMTPRASTYSKASNNLSFISADGSVGSGPYNNDTIIAAITNSGELYVCGKNSTYGMIGNGIIPTSPYNPIGVPYDVAALNQNFTLIKTSGTSSNFIDVRCIVNGIMGLTNSGDIMCIGKNKNGVFGMGSNLSETNFNSYTKTSGNIFFDRLEVGEHSYIAFSSPPYSDYKISSLALGYLK